MNYMKLDEMKSKLVDSRTGIIHKLDNQFENYLGLIPMHMITSYKTDTLDADANTISHTSELTGLGYDFHSLDKAQERTIGESIERYCSMLINQPIMKLKANEIKDKINLFNITRYTDEQILEHNLNIKQISNDTELYWVKGKDELNKGIEKWIPTDLVYLNHFYKDRPIREMTSTGLAAGPTLSYAIINGILECIERDSFTIMWQNRLSMPIINQQSIKSKIITNVLDKIEQLGLKVTIIDMTSDIEVPSYLTIIQNNKPPYTTFGASTHFSSKEALLSSIREASACYNLNIRAYIEGYNPELTSSDFGSFTDFHQHAAFYAYQENIEAINFLFKGEIVNFQNNKTSWITNSNDLLEHLKYLGIDTYSIDITSNDVKKVGLHVARVIMPKLAFLEVSYPMLNCERIFKVPLKLGYKLDGLNPYPHPFP